jgi:hypothetical protein
VINVWLTLRRSKRIELEFRLSSLLLNHSSLQVHKARSMTQKRADREFLSFVVSYSIIYVIKCVYWVFLARVERRRQCFPNAQTVPPKRTPVLRCDLLLFQTLLLLHSFSSSLCFFTNALHSFHPLPLFVHISHAFRSPCIFPYP